MKLVRRDGASPSEALKVLHKLDTERKMPCVEPFNLFDAGAGILGEGIDVDLAL